MYCFLSHLNCLVVFTRLNLFTLFFLTFLFTRLDTVSCHISLVNFDVCFYFRTFVGFFVYVMYILFVFLTFKE